MAKQWLTKHEIEFEEIRVDTNQEARQFLLDQGHKMIPHAIVRPPHLRRGPLVHVVGRILSYVYCAWYSMRAPLFEFTVRTSRWLILGHQLVR